MFSKEILWLDVEAEVNRIRAFVREQVAKRYKRKGVVVGLSGGVDSALVATLCVRALGTERVVGLLLPEKESNPVSVPYAEELAYGLGIKTETIDLTAILSALGVYENRDQAIKRVCPDYNPASDKTKIALPGNLLERDGLNVFTLTVEKAEGPAQSFRLGPDDLRAIQAAQNIKQRTRMIQLHYQAEKLHYLVAGTTNRAELEMGFFVKCGDGGVDIEPIAHLYKTQVFQLARHVGVPGSILERLPSPDTWSAGVGDEEFYFRMPFATLDLLLYARNNRVPVAEICEALDLTNGQVDRVFRDFESKTRMTWHLRCMAPSLCE